MKRILVTGATGFIGRHVCELLVADGFEVIGMIRSASNASLLNDVQLADVLVREAVDSKKFAGLQIDGIVHCAAAYGREGDRHSELVDVNLAYPLELLDFAHASDVGMFVYLDTCFKLDYPYLRPYTLSKKQMVDWGRLTSTEGRLRFVNLQLQHPFGPGDRAGKFVPWVIEKCLENASVDLTAGDQAKDFIFVSDVADAISCLLHDRTKLPPGFHEFECGRGEGVPVRVFVEAIHRLTKSQATLNFGALPTRPNEVMHCLAEIGPLKNLGWQPAVSLEEGLVRTIDSIRERMAE